MTLFAYWGGSEAAPADGPPIGNPGDDVDHRRALRVIRPSTCGVFGPFVSHGPWMWLMASFGAVRPPCNCSRLAL